MRSFRHWTFHYLISRWRDLMYRYSHPEDPWLTPDSIQLLNYYLKPEDVGLEFGSGRSTLWFAKHVAVLTSVEHDESWFEKINRAIIQQQIANVTLLHVQLSESEIHSCLPEYVRVVDRFDDESLDFILVDGKYRGACANASIDKISPGGLLILDNADIYLPSESITPNARTLDQGPASSEWERFIANIKNWRRVWTCNGISATTLFFKPCSH